MEFQRATDNVDQHLSRLIAAEDDPGKRANLLILQAMALNLSANTMALNALSTEIYDHKREFIAHREEFKTHAADEAEILNKIRGGSKVFMFFITGIQMIVFGVLAWGVGNYSETVTDLHQLQVTVSAYHAKVDQLVETHRK